MKHLVLASILSVLVVGFSGGSMADDQKKPTGWLSEAESDEKRFQLLQKYLRGFLTSRCGKWENAINLCTQH